MLDLREGDRIGQYVLERTIDRGAFGRVWRALDTASGKTVAIKVLAADSSEEHMKARADLERLAAAAARDSSHIVRVLASGHEPVPHIVMEFVDGTNLREELSDRGPLPQDEVIRIALQVADALRALHRVRVVHRDVKPANILLDPQGEVRLTDFGIAKILGYDETVTLTQHNLLSAPYAAPEVWEGAPNPQSDLYAFGAVVFEMLTGRGPFQGDLMDLFRRHRTEEPDLGLLPPHVAPSLREMVYLCLRKTPDERPQTADVCIRLLERARQELRKEPERFGPWLRVAHHPALEWAWLCRHEKTGEQALVEVHFVEDEAYGDMLRAAVNVNPKLVPLGAEPVLGANRLLLADDEGWPNAPEHNLAFWVARREVDVEPISEELDRQGMLRAVEAFMRLTETASHGGVRLSVDAERAVVRPDGSVFLHRPGLPPTAPVEPRLGAFILLRSMALTEDAAAVAASARDLRDLRDKLARPRPSAAPQRPARRLSAVAILTLAAVLAAAAGVATALIVVDRQGGSAKAPSVVATQPPPQICSPIALPAEISAARAACSIAGPPQFEFDGDCPLAKVCKVESSAGVALLRGNDQTIAYVDPSGDLYVAREGGFAATRLFQDGRIRQPAWSPDGRYIAYVLAKTTATGTDTELWVLDSREPAGQVKVLSSSDSPGTPEFKRRRISDPHWGADGRSLYFLWQPAEPAAEIWNIALPQSNGALDTREMRLWDGAPSNMNRVSLSSIGGEADVRITSMSTAADGALLFEYCLKKNGACGLARWDASGARTLAAPAARARFLTPLETASGYLALSLDGSDAVLVQVDATGNIKPAARTSAGLAPDERDLSLSATSDGRFLVGTAAGLALVSPQDGSSTPVISGKWGSWFVPQPAPAFIASPASTPFSTPVLSPAPAASPTPPPGGDADLSVTLVQASCAIGQELVITVRNLGPNSLDRDAFITIRAVADSTTKIGNTNKGLSGLQPGQAADVRTGYTVAEAVTVQLENQRDRNPANNSVTCTPR